MNKFYLSLCAFALGSTLTLANAAGLSVTFNDGTTEGWQVLSGGTGEVKNGHLDVTMAMQGTGPKYRADLKLADANHPVTLTASEDCYLAIKFIGTRPSGNITPEIKGTINGTNVTIAYNNKPAGSYATANNNNIYYWNLTSKEAYTGTIEVTQIQLKIADATAEPYSYSIDWIKTFPSLEALDLDKNWNDDTNDTDEPADVAAPVVNETTGVSYANLVAAWNAAANNDVITVNEDQEITERLNSNDRAVTIKGNGNVTISRASSYSALLFLSNSKTSTITLENLTIDGIDKTVGCSFEASGNGTLTMNNVTVKNCISNNNQGLVSVKNGGKFNATDLVIENCTVPEGRGEVFAGTNNVTLAGDCKLSLYIQNTYYVKATALTSPISVYFDAGRAFDTELIHGNADASLFKLADSTYKLVAQDGNLILASSTTGIESIIGDENARLVNVYNIQGMLIRSNVEAANATDGLDAGLYIIGGKKVYVNK